MTNPLHYFLRLFGVFEKVSNNIKSSGSRVKSKSSLPEKICRQFSLHEIIAATDNFNSNLIIGRNRTGVVYKGFLRDDQGTLVVSVNCFIRGQSGYTGLKEFRNEVQMLCQLRHQNLCPLIGFCDDKDQLILVYNYMSNNSLYHRLHGTGHDPLTWKQRLEICIGAAHGLHYLHTGAKRAVIHRNINTQNILLDDQRVPKLCDFGLSKLGPSSMSKAPLMIELPLSDEELSTTMACNSGYLDPEFLINTTLVTDKSDVYSFGVVLLEVLCGRQVIKIDAEEDKKHLILWVSKHIRNGKIYQTIDPYLKGKIAPSCLEKFLDIALSCIKVQGNKRPALGEVETTLELALKLQNKSDSEIERINPQGECIYEEVVFSSPALDFSDYAQDILWPQESFRLDGSKTEEMNDQKWARWR